MMWLLAATALLTVLTAASMLLIDRRGRRDTRAPSDAIVVLGAAFLPDGSPGSIMKARVGQGVKLFKEGLAAVMIVTGGPGPCGIGSSARSMADMAESLGVPREKIILEERARNTRENAAFVASIMGARSWKKALLVTCPFHMIRSLLLFRTRGIEATGSPALHSPAFTRKGLRAVYLMREVASLLFFYLPDSLRGKMSHLLLRLLCCLRPKA